MTAYNLRWCLWIRTFPRWSANTNRFSWAD